MRQRAFDVVLCVLALPVFVLVGGAIAIAVFLDSPGPVFYRAPRIGRGGRPFSMLKFRTMRHGAGGPPLSAAGDERYTPLGHWLARHRLDELPQVWNVLRGEMRLVGPRPELAEFVADYPDEYERILRVLPGLTGPAQLEFAREGELLAAAADRVELYRRSVLPAKVEIDLAYAARPSVRRDLALLLRTAVLPVARLRRYALMLGAAQTRPAPATTATLAVSAIAATLTGVFAVEAIA
ncbi:MAG TPA: sugar transferase [Solirubrobacteraceae bacterium]|nr:sugar transferase [Solirubrobacteraceae bacterium]